MPPFPSDRARGHALLPDALADSFPQLYALDGQGKAAPVTAKFFSSNATVFLTEFDGDDSFFGYICSPFGRAYDELTYFSLSELATATRTDIPGHPLWERDLDFATGTSLGDAIAQHYKDSGAAA